MWSPSVPGASSRSTSAARRSRPGAFRRHRDPGVYLGWRDLALRALLESRTRLPAPGGIVIGGRALWRAGYAGDLGHLVFGADGQVCGCGGRGCLENIASARAISARYVTLLGSRLAFQPPPRLAHAELGDMAGCLGAALLAWRPAGHETMVAARERRS